jgi:trehalose 6-phosphate phosphatase
MTHTATVAVAHGTGQPVPILDHLVDVEKRIAAASHLAVFLDFDGTLSPIVSSPQEAILDDGIRPILADVRERVGLNGVVYAGNHGLEAESDTISYRNPEAEAMRRELKCTLLQLRLALSETDGLEIEDKGLTLAVHFRRVTEHLHDWVRSITLSTVGRSRSFTCREGKMVIDIKPRIEWHKGYAVQWILKEIMPPGALPIYLGDDVTDEDAFAAIREGITIKVGGSVETGAQYKLPDVPSVGQFLNWLNHAKPHESFATA